MAEKEYPYTTIDLGDSDEKIIAPNISVVVKYGSKSVSLSALIDSGGQYFVDKMQQSMH